MLIGYARVSTIDQRLDLQQDALRGQAVSASSAIPRVVPRLSAWD
jgi:DNA invertase Pin-like site-specific DNA recombinase